MIISRSRRGPDEQPRDQGGDEVQGRRRHDSSQVLRHRGRLLRLAGHRGAAAGARVGPADGRARRRQYPLHVGMRVVARGNAQGRGSRRRLRAAGSSPSTSRSLPRTKAATPRRLNNVIATNAPVMPGYSGGPAREQSEPRSRHRSRRLDLGRPPWLRDPAQAGATDRPPDRERQVDCDRARRAEQAFLGVVLEDAPGGAKITSLLPGKPADRPGSSKETSSPH